MKKKPNYLPQLLIGCLLIIATIVGYVYSRQRVRELDEIRFQKAVLQAQHLITSRMENYINALSQTRSMFSVTREVDGTEFKDYVQSLEITEKYPGIQGVGFTLKIAPENLKGHQKAIQQNGQKDYHVWPSHKRDQYFSIIYLEPLNWRNKRAIGFDMFTDPTRRRAMEVARDSGEPAMSGVVELVQEAGEIRQKGFLIYVPVYLAKGPTQTAEDRGNNLLGFVYSPFRTGDLFQQMMSSLEGIAIDIEVSVLEGQSEKLIFDRVEENAISQSDLHSARTITLAQKPWIIRIGALPAFRESAETALPLIILALGLILSLLVTAFLIRLARQASDLEQRSQILEKLGEASSTVMAELNLDDLLKKLTDIGRELSGAAFGAFFYNTVNDKGESYVLYTVSGVPRDKFSQFPMPRNTEVFAPTFAGETLLSDDITKDPRFGKNAPYYGLPAGHLPVRSYLAVGVKGRSGEVIGGLFYGHSQVGKFTARERQLIEGLAPQAAIAIDNARLYQEAQKAIEAREEFLSIASHELKTPITSMKLQFQTAERMIEKNNHKVFDPTAVEKRVTTALKQLTRMVKLIDDMLDSSRISLNKCNMSSEIFDLNKLMISIIDRYSEQFYSEQISFDYSNPTHPVYVLGDEYRIEQVITNLLNNAIKYGEKKPISMRLFLEANHALLEVEDHGIGIPAESSSRIFDRYVRVPSAHNISGLGLGLYITRKIVEAHDGRIEVKSAPGRTIFTVRFPLESEANGVGKNS